MKKIFHVIVLGLVFLPLNLSAQTTTVEDQQSARVKNMNWQRDTTLNLPLSKGRLVIPDGFMAVKGADAASFSEMINGASAANGLNEAVMIDKDLQSNTHFMFIDSGYVGDKDFAKIDAAKLMDSIIVNTEKHNAVLKDSGISPIHVTKWLREPSYDPATHSAHWAIQAHDESDGDLVNNVGIKLGRNGYEMVRLVSSLKIYNANTMPIDSVLADFSFSTGQTYQDHISSDRMAGYGIAALVGSLVGAGGIKAASAVAAGGLALFFKSIMAAAAAFVGKLWILLLAPFVWLKSLFTRKTKIAQNTPTNDADPSSEG